MEQLGPDADALNVVMVTVDPERDTPEILHEYVAAFDERFRGFTGTPEDVACIAEAYKFHYERVDGAGTNPAVAKYRCGRATDWRQRGNPHI